jgi:hypothetical protein
VQHGDYQQGICIVQRGLVVSLRRKSAAQVRACGAGRDACRPERPGIEDKAFAAGAQAELYLAVPRHWHIGELDFFFTQQQISSDIRFRAAINS